mmetsp:Transcript_11736/g.28839  ORF Transcript_11736/g.28839 Transcript_11736/m.28839 type:complete len:717 (-) Transcript_11736:854-3004(-)
MSIMVDSQNIGSDGMEFSGDVNKGAEMPSLDEPEGVMESPSNPDGGKADEFCDDRRTPEKITAPEPPRWRFVNEAKKSLGYSSLAAGTYVEGRSSDDLGAKYVAPDISAYVAKEEKAELNSQNNVVYWPPTATNEGPVKADVDIGKLDVISLPLNAFVKQQREVGTFQIKEASSNEAQIRSGIFAGFPTFETQPKESRKPFKEWGANITMRPKEERDNDVWYDGEVRDSYTLPGGGISSMAHEEVGKLKFHDSGSGEEFFVGEFSKSNADGNERGVAFSEDGYSDAREGALFVHRNCSSHETHEVVDDSDSLATPTNGEHRRKQRCLYLLLLLLLVLVVILGVLLGKKNGDERAIAAGNFVAAFAPPVTVANDTTVPSSLPSMSPSTECPLGTKPFSIEHLQHRTRLPTMNSVGATWKIKDACSDEVVARCLPCPIGALKAFQLDESFAQLRSNEVENIFKGITKCLPIKNEYVFEVLPAPDAEPCCGFNPAVSIISYDNMLIKLGASDLHLFSSDSNRVYFGEVETPCTSESPSALPTIKASERPSLPPSQEPSYVPSSSPSFSPTLTPSTSPPTKSPVFFLGGCPESFVPRFSYMIGAQVESDGMIYECISRSCGSFGFEPGSSMSGLWSGWGVVGSCAGTMAPTNQPTSSPTRPPSQTPTQIPSKAPSSNPSNSPTTTPSKAPTPNPSPAPTQQKASDPVCIFPSFSHYKLRS